MHSTIRAKVVENLRGSDISRSYEEEVITARSEISVVESSLRRTHESCVSLARLDLKVTVSLSRLTFPHPSTYAWLTHVNRCATHSQCRSMKHLSRFVDAELSRRRLWVVNEVWTGMVMSFPSSLAEDSPNSTPASKQSSTVDHRVYYPCRCIMLSETGHRT